MNEKAIKHLKRQIPLEEFFGATANRSKEYLEGLLRGIQLVDANFDIEPDGDLVGDFEEYLKDVING